MRQIAMMILGIGLWAVWLPTAVAQLKAIVISAPGPHNLSYLPVDLIPKLGVDQALGYHLKILHTGGGAVALQNLVTRNADFAVAGVPAAMSSRANGGDVVLIAPVNDKPLFVLMVRTALAGQVQRIADLRGRVIGVNTSTKKSKTTSQQLVELLLKAGGIGIDEVRMVPAGQTWIEQSSLLLTNTVDAVMGDEPFASRLLARQQVFFLANLAEPKTVAGIAGIGFLHAALETRSDVIRQDPAMVQAMVTMLRQTLVWMAQNPPEAIVAQLQIEDGEERTALVEALTRYPNAFSRDGQFSAAQLQETDLFYASGQTQPDLAPLAVTTMTDSRWAGSKP